MKKFTIDWVKAALIRAIRTMAQAALGMITIGSALSDINWLHVLSVAMVSGVYSILTSLATTLPEVATDGELIIDDTRPDKDIWSLSVNDSLDTVSSKKRVVFKVKNVNDRSQ